MPNSVRLWLPGHRWRPIPLYNISRSRIRSRGGRRGLVAVPDGDGINRKSWRGCLQGSVFEQMSLPERCWWSVGLKDPLLLRISASPCGVCSILRSSVSSSRSISASRFRISISSCWTVFVLQLHWGSPAAFPEWWFSSLSSFLHSGAWVYVRPLQLKHWKELEGGEAQAWLLKSTVPGMSWAGVCIPLV